MTGAGPLHIEEQMALLHITWIRICAVQVPAAHSTPVIREPLNFSSGVRP
jgi:hypothetical protein